MNCILRDSVRTERNFSPALNVRSITLPSAARRSFVRTNAPPLPGLTCWKSTILKIVPSTSMWLPFLNWLVLIAMWRCLCPLAGLPIAAQQRTEHRRECPRVSGGSDGGSPSLGHEGPEGWPDTRHLEAHSPPERGPIGRQCRAG